MDRLRRVLDTVMSALGSIMEAAQFAAVAIPTLAAYAWIGLFGWRALHHLYRSAGAARWRAWLYGALALAPVVIYCAQYGAAFVKHRQLDAFVQSAHRIPQLSNPPRTLVIHGARRDGWQEDLVEMGAFDAVYVISPRDPTIRLANAASPSCDGGAFHSNTQRLYRARTGFLVCAVAAAVDRAPSDGLHFHVGRQAPSAGSARNWEFGNLQELRLIDGSGEQLVGFWGNPLVVYPVFPPAINLTGFATIGEVSRPVPNEGELPFIFGRLGLDIEKLKPLAQPSTEEVRAEFLRRRDLPDRRHQQVAGFIATAVGAAVLSADDVAPLLASNVIDRDFAREIGYEQFCYHINRLCDFPDQLIAACKSKRAHAPGSQARCDRLPRQCEWCRTTPQCNPSLTGQTTRCSNADDDAREVTLGPLRRN